MTTNRCNMSEERYKTDYLKIKKNALKDVFKMATQK